MKSERSWKKAVEATTKAQQAEAKLEEAKTSAPDTSQTSPPAQEGRPSLEVAIETHRNLQKRVEALCLRLAGWSVPGGGLLIQGFEGAFHREVMEARLAMRKLGQWLDGLQTAGFVAKSTPKSRMEARLSMGAPIRLSEAKRKLYSYSYDPEEFEQVKVVDRCDDGTIWVRVGKRDGVLPIPLKLSDLEAP